MEISQSNHPTFSTDSQVPQHDPSHVESVRLALIGVVTEIVQDCYSQPEKYVEQSRVAQDGE